MCICAVTVTIAEMLVSDTALEKNIRLFLGAFMLCAVIVPLGGVVSDLRDGTGIVTETAVPDEPGDEIEQNRLGYIRRQIAELINERLAQNGISPLKTEVLTDIDEDGSINIITAELTLDRRDARRAAFAGRLIKNELGIACRTIISQQDGG